MWTQFWDMHSGGSTKQDKFDKIYIEASEEEAKVIFENRFGHDPTDVACSCCGENYSISEYETLLRATAYERKADYENPDKPAKKWRSEEFEEMITLEDYLKSDHVLVVPKEDILDSERAMKRTQRGRWVYVED